MGYYINNQGVVIEALQWDGTEESAKEIEIKFPLTTEQAGVYLYLYDELTPDNSLAPGKLSHGSMYLKDYLYVDDFGNFSSICSDEFEKRFKPITNPRVILAERFKKQLLVELEKKQHKGDDWREYSWSELHGFALEEFKEQSTELYKMYMPGLMEPDIDNLIAESAHSAIVSAFIADKAAEMKRKGAKKGED